MCDSRLPLFDLLVSAKLFKVHIYTTDWKIITIIICSPIDWQGQEKVKAKYLCLIVVVKLKIEALSMVLHITPYCSEQASFQSSPSASWGSKFCKRLMENLPQSTISCRELFKVQPRWWRNEWSNSRHVDVDDCRAFWASQLWYTSSRGGGSHWLWVNVQQRSERLPLETTLPSVFPVQPVYHRFTKGERMK